MLHRVTPDHYNLYNEAETLVGQVHRVGYYNEPDKETWYGRHVTGQVTGIHPTRHHAARELMDMPGDVPK
jgi:hypothetical protein